ncbi:MAG: hypothetical protein J3Q66DRAFT_336102 [Benniella sp.]|nr:MAG: hypothetical protein J3Q66DRAFT_336102 [Benniella sp.]
MLLMMFHRLLHYVVELFLVLRHLWLTVSDFNLDILCSRHLLMVISDFVHFNLQLLEKLPHSTVDSRCLSRPTFFDSSYIRITKLVVCLNRRMCVDC